MKSDKLLLIALTVGAISLGRCALAEESAPAPAESTEVFAFNNQGVLLLKTKDDTFKWWLDGRIMLDAAFYVGSKNELSNGAELRRGRLGFNMVYWKDWASQFDVEFADNAVEVKDMWLGYTGFDHSLIRVGQFKEPFGLETLISSRYISFMERSVIDSFSPDRHLGVAYSRWGNHWQASAGFFGQAIGDTDSTGQDQGYGATIRATAAPIRTDDTVLHFGVAASYRTPAAGSGDTIRFRTRPETHVNRGRFVDTGKISSVNHYSLLGGEFAAAKGPWSVQAEYVRDQVSRYGGKPKAVFNGWYGYASWFPTGDHRPYAEETGEFDRVIPRNKSGALELVARYSTINLNDFDASIVGGRERNVTAGVNWYANANVRIMFDFGRVFTDKYSKGDRKYRPNDNFNILQTRFQLNF